MNHEKSPSSTPLSDQKTKRFLLTIEDMHRIAHERGGLCLSETYVNTNTHLLWQCAKKHQWHAMPGSIRKGSWCRVCVRESQRLTLEDMQQIAAGRGGLCLSQTYVNSSSHLRWQCAQKHEWTASPDNIKGGRWCPMCKFDQGRLGLDEMQRMANEHGGQCLSKTYRNVNRLMRWRCAQGHIWEAPGATIRGGHWCNQCASDKMRGSIEDMQAIAVSRGGVCLSTRYQNVLTELRWQCAAGHVWLAQPRVVNLSWCPECAHDRRRLGIPAMQELAAKRGGRCLSDEYQNIYRPLAWQCIEGHCWDARPVHIKLGYWCPECRRVEQDKKKLLDNAKKKERFSMPKLS